MSGIFFDRSILHNLERPLSSDLNRVQSQLDRTLRDTLRQIYAQRISPVLDPGDDQMNASVGFIGDSFKVRPEIPASGNIRVSSGLGFMVNPSPASSLTATNPNVPVGGLDDLSLYSPLPLSSVVTFAVPTAPAAGFGRKDIIQVKADRHSENPLTRGIWDTILKKFTGTLVDKTYAWDLLTRTETVVSPAVGTFGLVYKKGVAGAYADDDSFLAAGTVPDTAADPGYVKVATINVRPAATTFDENVIVDWRPLLFPGGVGHVGASLQLNTTTNTLTFLRLHAPPGVCATFRQPTPGTQRIDGYFLLGNASLLTPGIPMASWSRYADPYIYMGAATGMAAGEVNLALQTSLATALPNLHIGVGQRYLTGTWMYGETSVMAGALSTAIANLNTFEYDIAAFFQRNGNP